jgi:hypothetical protein
MMRIVAISCVLCTLRAQISRSICNDMQRLSHTADYVPDADDADCSDHLRLCVGDVVHVLVEAEEQVCLDPFFLFLLFVRGSHECIASHVLVLHGCQDQLTHTSSRLVFFSPQWWSASMAVPATVPNPNFHSTLSLYPLYPLYPNPNSQRCTRTASLHGHCLN